VIGFDIDASAIECVRHNAKQQGIPIPTLKVRPLQNLTQPTKTGYLVTNPPYGERIKSHAHITGIYQTLSQKVQAFTDWRCFLLYPPNELYQETGFHRTEERITLYNGPLKCRFLELDFNRSTLTESVQSDSVSTESSESPD
jgi:putative N6-adenine-specific DNA methylase